MEEVVKQVRQNLKTTQDWKKEKKRYVDLQRVQKEFNVGDQVYLKVKPKKNTLIIGNYAKLSLRYYGCF